MQKGVKIFRKRVYFSILAIIISISLISVVSSSHNVTTPNGGDSYAVSEDANYKYNLQIYNNDIGINSGITQVNISLPSSFTFIPGSENTNAPYESFSETNMILSWSNHTSHLVYGNEWKYFEFTAISSTPGNYTLNIITVNSTGQYSSGLFIEILKGCAALWNCTNWLVCVNGSQTRTCTDENNCGDDFTKPDEIRVCTILTTNCTPNWECTIWSECIKGKQIRSCVDANLCGNNSDKPIEIQECVSVCKPIWDCSRWKPLICSKDETQTRTCTDVNNCGNEIDMPNETRECKRDALLFFIILIIIIATIIVMISIRTIEEWWRNRPKKILKKQPPKKPPPRPIRQQPRQTTQPLRQGIRRITKWK